MEYIIRGLTFALIPIVVSGVLALLHRPKKTEKGKVCLPIALAIVGVICSVAFLIPTFICAFSDTSVWISAIFLLLAMLSSLLIVAYINCRIDYDEDGFTAKNFFGIKRRFTYDQITARKYRMQNTVFYLGKRKIVIYDYAVGRFEFHLFVKKKYRRIYKKAIPEKVNKDILNGNLHSPLGFVLLDIVMGILGIGFLISIVCWVHFSRPYSPDNTIKQQVIFQTCQKKGGDWILKATDGKIYKIEDAYKSLDAESISSLCDGRTLLTTYSNEVSRSRHNKQFYYSVKAIVRDGEYVLTFDQTHQFFKQGAVPLILLLLTLNLMLAASFAGCVIVGRNPSKYDKKFIRLLFRSGWVKNTAHQHRKKR